MRKLSELGVGDYVMIDSGPCGYGCYEPYEIYGETRTQFRVRSDARGPIREFNVMKRSGLVVGMGHRSWSSKFAKPMDKVVVAEVQARLHRSLLLTKIRHFDWPKLDTKTLEIILEQIT